MPGRGSELHTGIGLCSEAGMWPIWSGQLGRDSSLLTPIYFGPVFPIWTSSKQGLQPRGDAYLPDFTGHVPLVWELKPHLEGMLSPGEMEVTSESTDGSSRESQAGKEDSPRAVRLLGTFLFIESKLRHDAVRQKTGMKTVDEQIVNDFGFWVTGQCFKQTFLQCCFEMCQF